MLDELANHHQLPTKLRVGLTHSGENSSIISALGNYSKNNENISFTIFTNTNKQLYTMLENDELDLIIVEEKKTEKNLSFIDLGTDEILAIASSSNPLSKEKQVQLEQLKKEK